ncbi:MAG: C-terminal binding protein, partial [candidate division NC10 bacterium]|nr:C-terminal binding protein [candidate division NC10 bacterium]
GPEREILAEVGAEFIAAECRNEEETIRATAGAHAVLNASAKITARVIESLEDCLVIARYGIGVDNVDIPAATEKGIILCNVPDFCFEEVSDTAMSLILATTRKVCQMSHLVKKGIWNRSLAKPIHKFSLQTLGLIAFGNIARTLVKKAKPFGFRIIAYDPYVDPKVGQQAGVELVSLDRLLRESDIISIHAPLTQETFHLIGEAEMKKMKPSAFLINTGRGPLVDGKALYEALREGRLAGAGLDVMEKEPPDPSDPLLTLDNVVFTPHYASYTEEAYHELAVKAAQGAASVLRGEFPKYFVNQEVKEKSRMLQRVTRR